MPECRIVRVEAGEMGNNSYIIFQEDRSDCIIVDTAGDGRDTSRALESLGKMPVALLLTHGHADHISSLALLRKEFGVPVAIHEADADMLNSPKLNLSKEVLGMMLTADAADYLLEDEDVLKLAGIRIQVIHTPGHTPGSVCYLCGDKLVTGDTLFRLGIGRTDFPGGSQEQLENSLDKLFALTGDYSVYPGHGEPTTLEMERIAKGYRRAKRQSRTTKGEE